MELKIENNFYDLSIEVEKYSKNLLERQERLGAEFEKVLFDNLWELYARD